MIEQIKKIEDNLKKLAAAVNAIIDRERDIVSMGVPQGVEDVGALSQQISELQQRLVSVESVAAKMGEYKPTITPQRVPVFGKLITGWTATPTASVNPCSADGLYVDTGRTVTVNWSFPTGSTRAGDTLAAGSLVSYLPYYNKSQDKTLGIAIGVGVGGGSLPTATSQYQVITANASLDWEAGWVKAHA